MDRKGDQTLRKMEVRLIITMPDGTRQTVANTFAVSTRGQEVTAALEQDFELGFSSAPINDARKYHYRFEARMLPESDGAELAFVPPSPDTAL